MRAFIFMALLLTLAGCGKHESTSYGFSNTSNTIQGDKAGTPEELMVLSILNDDKELFHKTIETVTDINFRLKESRTFLIEAARNQRALFVHALLQKGADRTLMDGFQKTALDYALEDNSKKIQFLLDENQFPKIQAEMWTALTALSSSKKVMDAIEAGADPNIINEQGETALTYLIKSLNYADKKNKAPMILKDVIEWQDDLFGLTTTRASVPNALGETPMFLIENRKKSTVDPDEIKKIDSLIQKLQQALAQEAP